VVPTRTRAALGLSLELLAWSALVLVACPGLLVNAWVDQPDEYLEFHAATLAFFAAALEQGRLDWWNPYKHGGGSVFGDPTTLAPFYPLMLLLRWVPLDLLMPAALVLHLALGAAGLNRLARSLGVGPAGGVAAGICGLLSTWSVVPLVDGQLDMAAIVGWTPWALLALLHAMRSLQAARGSPERARFPRMIAAAALCLGLVALGSHARFAAVTFATVGVAGTTLWLLPPEGRRPHPLAWGLVLGGALVLGGLLAAPALLPAIAELAVSRSGPPDNLARLSGQVLPAHGLPGLIYPRALVLDERWHHLGVGLLVCLSGASDRRCRWLMAASVVLLLMAMGSSGPLFFLVRPVFWLLYPVESSVGFLALPMLAVVAGLAVHRLTGALETGDEAWLRRWRGVLLIGLPVVLLGWWADRGLYLPSVRSVGPLQTASLVHGVLAVGGLAAVLALGRRLGPRRLAVAVLALLLADGLAYSWRVHAAIESPRVRPSDFVSSPSILDGLERRRPSGRVLQWPQRRIRGIPSCLHHTTSTGHGWFHAGWLDPVRLAQEEGREVVDAALPRNAGARSGIPQVGGRAKVPPMPWSAMANWMSARATGPGVADEEDDDDRRPGSTEPLLRRTTPLAVGGTTPWGPLGDIVDRHGPPCCEHGPLRGGVTEERWIPRVLELLHVHHVVSTTPMDRLPGADAVPSAEGARFAVVDPRPLALMSAELLVAADLEEAERLIFEDEVDLRVRAVVLAPAPELHGGGGAPAVVGVTDHSPGRWTLVTPSDAGLVTVAERYHPGWQALDGQGRELVTLSANLTMLGVVVPAGTERVQLRFRPPDLGRGLAVGGGALLLSLVLLVAGLRRPRQ